MIRVYYQDVNNIVQEYCLDSSWYQGSALVTAPPGISLAAVAWQGKTGTNLRVYYQDANNVIQEYCWNATWYQGSQLPVAIQDSLLAAACWVENGSPQIRVLFQGTDGAIHEEAFSCEAWELAGGDIPVLPIA